MAHKGSHAELDISDNAPAPPVIRGVASEMGFDEGKIAEFLSALEHEAVSTVSDLRMLEVTHWKELRIPFGLANRIKQKIKKPVVAATLRRGIVPHLPPGIEDKDDDISSSSNNVGTLISPHLSPRSDGELPSSPPASPTVSLATASSPPASQPQSSTPPTSVPPSPTVARALRIGDVRGRAPVRGPKPPGGGWISASPARASLEAGVSGVTVSAALAQLDMSRTSSLPGSPEPPRRAVGISISSPLLNGTTAAEAESSSGPLDSSSMSSSPAGIRRIPSAATSLPQHFQAIPPPGSGASTTSTSTSSSFSDSNNISPRTGTPPVNESWHDFLRNSNSVVPPMLSPTVPLAPTTPAIPASHSATLKDSRELNSSTRRLQGPPVLTMADEPPPIQSGTLEKLIEMLVPEEGIPDWKFITDFLVVFRYFTSPQDLMQKLLTKYNLKAQQKTPDNKKAGAAVAVRVLNILRKWVALHWYDFEEHRDMLTTLLEFLSGSVITDHPIGASSLLFAVQEKEPESLLHLLRRPPGVPPPGLEVIAEAMKKPSSRLLQNRGKDGKHKFSFIATEWADWLVRQLHLTGRADVLPIGKRLLEENFIVCVAGADENDREFKLNEGVQYSLVWKSEREQALMLQDPPKPKKLPSHKTQYTLLDFHPLEVARQCTLIEFNLFKRIRPTEIRSQAWTKPNADVISPNLCKLVDMWNKHSCWAATEILNQPDLEKRREVLRWFLAFASHLRELQNFNAVLAIVSGLNFAAISRLKQTWKAVSSSKNIIQELTDVTSPLNNYKIYREELKQAGNAEPCIPCVVVYLKDLTFIEDGNVDYLDAQKTVINFVKMRMISSVFLEIQKYQEKAYHFVPVVPVMDVIRNRRVTTDQNELYEKSIVVEPSDKSKSVAYGRTNSFGTAGDKGVLGMI